MGTGVIAAHVGEFRQDTRTEYTRETGLPDLPIRGIDIRPEGGVWIAVADGVYQMDADGRCQLAAPGLGEHAGGTPLCMAVDGNGALWCGTSGGLYVLDGGSWVQAEEGVIVALAELPGESGMMAATHQALRRASGGEPIELCLASEDTVRDFCVRTDGTVFVATSDGLLRLRHGERDMFRADACDLLSSNVYAVVEDSVGHLWVGTSAGVNLFDGESFWFGLSGIDGLAYEDVHCIALGRDDQRWFGTTRGAIRLRDGRWSYFYNRRWMPGEVVHDVALGDDGSAWLATDGGVSHIESRPMTMADKAALMEETIEARHKRHGYVTGCRLSRPGDLDSYRHDASDNEGLWTGLYVAAESFRYAVTGEQDARDKAARSISAVLDLTERCSHPGFPARALMKKDEPNTEQSVGEWHDTEDGEWRWKGDTSSDEIDGQFFALTTYHDLVADDAEKARIAAVAGVIVDHIIDHGYYLVDVDGKHTTWGVWAPEMLNGPWAAQRGLNSLEILSYLKSAYHLTGNERYQRCYLDLIQKHRYALNAINQKVITPGRLNHSDDEVAFCAYYPLMKYETDPTLRTLYLRSIERSWRIARPEKPALYNFIYGALTGNDCDAENGVRMLIEMPLDLIRWTVRNSHRADIVLDDRRKPYGELESREPLPRNERIMHKWNVNPYRLDDTRNGTVEEDPTAWLLPYWLGRYHGFIVE